MAEYTKVFENPYPNGWEDLPSENTPITADALQEHTDAIEHLEEYLEENPINDGTDVQWNQIVESGEEIAEIIIDGETKKVYAPKGGGGGGEAFVEMTKAEYDALPDTKLTDGVPRLITDYSEGSSGEIYDNTERVIGTWFGKPLYRKVMIINSLPSTPYSLTQYPHGITNIDRIIKYNISMQFNNSDKTASYQARNFPSSTYAGDLIQLGHQIDKTNLSIMVNVNRSSCSAYVIIEYTKVGD